MTTIIDYGIGNIKAIVSLLKLLGENYCIATKKEHILNSNRLILPGVGSFDNAMNSFNRSGLRDVIEQVVFNKNIPIIGICIGMHMLTEKSEEGKNLGLGWIDGEVLKLQSNEFSIRLPHMGYNDLSIHTNSQLLKGLAQRPEFYFLHSYYVRCNLLENVQATTNYGIDFHSVISKENIYGVQFHPEKSHLNGSELIKNFIKL
ncbi:imidazole glycerol phosphate synthase subunit HisH [Pedobacter punctiformis]|uniref:Imidazole glycerol phosphate synthase subunit HisH n=1 Tax=Pedobacter punctiformis TaxID=3004097 RepID=A0ABT4L4R0_9SPHI|nr:imidazole glycerol phosphate synthase subunit HisH [Pedobacter sp. HCMS5-2]MCZ4242907.1 imidazole glycerol phosphate synthase subunit HisH [Pedobacter sp. HCMS5-2]